MSNEVNEAMEHSQDFEDIVFTNRYEALGIPLPDPATMCPGNCEGIGLVPTKLSDEEPWRSLWLEAEAKEPTDDGWHFVECPTCKGTGKRIEDG